MKNFIWHNLQIREASEVHISPFDRGFQFGDGLFETIRIQKGKILFLKEHISRLTNSLEFLNYDIEHPFIRPILNPKSLEKIVNELLILNNLENKVCRMKIILSRGAHPELSLPVPHSPTVTVMIFNYREPNYKEYITGWPAITLSEVFTPCLASHKSISYLFYLWARQQAAKLGAREAILPDKDGMVAEGTMSNVLLFKDNTWYFPQSKWQLPGITIKEVVSALSKLNYKVVFKQISIENLRDFSTIWLTNSMIGVMPVSTIDNHKLPSLQVDLAEKIRDGLFNSFR